jgi:hypothetical protein
MKNYIIGLLLVTIFVLGSLFYKHHAKNSILDAQFPVKVIAPSDPPTLYLYVFFSIRNCRDCLDIIETLNTLPPWFVVRGVLPEEELKKEKEVRLYIGASFPLESQEKFKRFIPRYYPSVTGVSAKGEFFCVLPGVPGEKEYLQNFLNSMYQRLLNRLRPL